MNTSERLTYLKKQSDSAVEDLVRRTAVRPAKQGEAMAFFVRKNHTRLAWIRAEIRKIEG